MDPFLLQWLPALIAIGGWVIVNSQNNKRETRKEGRAAADCAKKLTMEAAALGVAYLKGDRADSFAVKLIMEALEVELARFPLFNQGSRLMGRYVDFDTAITGGDFESPAQPTFTASSPEIRKVGNARNQLLSEIEAQFKLHYC